jgi:UDP-glucose 4-epimerase
MKKILITGADSYIGTNVERWLMREPDTYQVDIIDMIDGSWREKDFSGYDVVFHVAGIAHVKETRKNGNLFYVVNRNLAIEVAQKAKSVGVLQFIFLSSMSVYGKDTGVITKDTVPKPKSSYGKSKLEAEEEIKSLADEKFIVAILRPPMIYGPGSKGNFPKLVALAKKTPIFPAYHNQRSMLYIDNLCEFVRLVIDNEKQGVFWPQNREYVDTCEVVRQVAEEAGHKIWITRVLNPFVFLGSLFIPTISKVFGTLVYQKDMTNNYSTDIKSFQESIKVSVVGQ